MVDESKNHVKEKVSTFDQIKDAADGIVSTAQTAVDTIKTEITDKKPVTWGIKIEEAAQTATTTAKHGIESVVSYIGNGLREAGQSLITFLSHFRI